MIQFTDTETAISYRVDQIGEDFNLHYGNCDGVFRTVPMTRSAAAVIGSTLLRYAAPDLLARKAVVHPLVAGGNVVQFPVRRVA